MQRGINSAAGWAGAWAAGLCLLQGCAVGPARSPATSEQPASATAATGTLDDAAVRRAESYAHFAAGISREASAGLDAAIEHYQQAVARAPGNTDLTIRLANILMSRRRFAEAAVMLEQATTTNPRLHEAWFWLGVAHKAQEQLPAATTALARALKLLPTYRNALQLLVEVHLQQDALPAVVELLEHARKQKTSDAVYWMHLGDLYATALKEKSGLRDQIPAERVLQCYEKASSLAPDDADLLRRLASYYETAEKPQQAAAYYARLAGVRPDDIDVRLKLATLHLQADNKEGAITEFEQILKRDPLRFQIYNFLGELYQDLGNDARALDNFQQSLVINPSQLPPHLNLAFLHIKQHDYPAALRTLAEAESKFPNDHEVPYLRGLVYSEKRDYPLALTAYAEAENLATQSGKKDKLDANFYFHHGGACERTGDLDKAAQLFRKATELDPKHHLAYNYLGYMWADKGVKLDEAHQLINKALELDPDNPAYLDSLGWVLFRKGQTEEALPHLRRAAELLKEPDATVFDHLADVLLKLGKPDEALPYLKRAAEIDPENKAIADKLKTLLGGSSSAAH